MKIDAGLAEAIADTGAEVHVGYPWWLRPLLLREVLAITLGRRIYLSAGMELRPPADVARLLRHELAHVRQAARLGLPRFLWRYAAEYVRNLRGGMRGWEAYRNISFEREAEKAEEYEGEQE